MGFISFFCSELINIIGICVSGFIDSLASKLDFNRLNFRQV